MAPEKTRISVVVPVLDDAEELAGCLAALAAQHRPADEVVVVDNGCRDASRTVAEAAGARVVDEPVRGIPAAAARGYDSATGNVLARLDADSRPGPDWLARVAQAFDEDPGLAALTGPGEFLELRGWRATAARLCYMRAYFVLVGSAMAHPTLFGSNMAMRSEVWRRVRAGVERVDPEIHDDIDLAFHLDPGDRVCLDRSLVVGISARPFAAGSGRRRRAWRALRTVARGWRSRPPWRRWAERWQAA